MRLTISQPNPSQTRAAAERIFNAAGPKIRKLAARWNPVDGTPVFTERGRYTSRGWTEWTHGFQFGMHILQFDGTGETAFLQSGRDATVRWMASHVTHTGVHDHGFNNVSTYGNLLRLMNEGALPEDAWERRFYELALAASGAVQTARWTSLPGDAGFIYSFNGPHSLFADTIRSLRVLGIAHQLGHVLMGECDERVSLLKRLLQHAEATAQYNVYFGEGRDAYDLPGRVAQESIFNLKDGRYRCPNSQQGYSPFSTWTRGLAWILCGYAEQLEFLATLPESEFAKVDRDQAATLARMERVAIATAEFYLRETPADGIPYWDTGAPNLHKLGDYLERPAEPDNPWEPVDSSAAAIAAQGLLRLGTYLRHSGEAQSADRYESAGLQVALCLSKEPYLCADPEQEGLLLHTVYHRPNGWDHLPHGATVPRGESCLWGDYHLMELAVLLRRRAEGETAPVFFLPDRPGSAPHREAHGV